MIESDEPKAENLSAEQSLSDKVGVGSFDLHTIKNAEHSIEKHQKDLKVLILKQLNEFGECLKSYEHALDTHNIINKNDITICILNIKSTYGMLDHEELKRLSSIMLGSLDEVDVIDITFLSIIRKYYKTLKYLMTVNDPEVYFNDFAEELMRDCQGYIQSNDIRV